MEFVESCKSDTNSGYGPTIKHDSHLLYTLSAIQIAAERNTLGTIHILRKHLYYQIFH